MPQLIDYSVSQNRKSILIFSSIKELEGFALKTWREIASAAIKERRRFSVALSGGNTPRGLYQRLSQSSDLPWNKTHVFIVDERFVPHDHGDSNYRMIKETLLDHINIPDTNIHPIPTDIDTPEKSAALYGQDLNAYFNTGPDDIPRFDLILLGIGDDGHTASLFPGSGALSEKDRIAASVSMRDKSTRDRITVTFPLINKARNIIFMATGEAKSGTIKEVIENRNSRMPAARVSPEEGNLFYLVDTQAGRLLTKK